MGTAFLSITVAEQQDAVATQIVMREREILSYETNIANYEAMLKAPTISADFAKRLKELLITENRELEKSKLLYETMKASLPVAQLTALVTAAKTRVDAAV